MRGRMNDGPSYVKPVELGAVMCGEVAGEVLESRHPKFAVGDRVAGDLGWQQYAAVDGSCAAVRTPVSPLTAQLSVCGMPGVTGVCRPARSRPARAWADRRRQPRPARSAASSARSRSSGLPRGRHRGRSRQMPIRHRAVRLRRPPRLQGGEVSATSSGRPRPTASTSTSTTSAARSSTPCCRG